MQQTTFGSRFKRLASALALASACCVAAPSTAQDAQSGTISVSYAPGINDASDELASILRDAAVFEDLAGGINETIHLPADMLVEFRNCETANAFYDPKSQQIVM